MSADLVTGEAVTLDIRPAGIGSRGAAAAIDLVVQVIALFVLGLLLPPVAGGLEPAAAITVLLLSYVAILLGYPVAMETLWRGRTVGKAALGIRAVRDDGAPIRFRHALVRGLVGVVLEKPGALFALPALLCMLVNTRAKRLGDLAAGTIVVQERVPMRQLPPPPMSPELAAWAATLDLTRVDDRLGWELRTFLARTSELTASARDQLGNRLVAEVAARVGPPPPGMPPWTYLTTVLAERRRRELERAAPPTTMPPPLTAPLPPPPTSSAPPPPPTSGGFAPPG